MGNCETQGYSIEGGFDDSNARDRVSMTQFDNLIDETTARQGNKGDDMGDEEREKSPTPRSEQVKEMMDRTIENMKELRLSNISIQEAQFYHKKVSNFAFRLVSTAEACDHPLHVVMVLIGLNYDKPRCRCPQCYFRGYTPSITHIITEFFREGVYVDILNKSDCEALLELRGYIVEEPTKYSLTKAIPSCQVAEWIDQRGSENKYSVYSNNCVDFTLDLASKFGINKQKLLDQLTMNFVIKIRNKCIGKDIEDITGITKDIKDSKDSKNNNNNKNSNKKTPNDGTTNPETSNKNEENNIKISNDSDSKTNSNLKDKNKKKSKTDSKKLSNSKNKKKGRRPKSRSKKSKDEQLRLWFAMNGH